MTQPHLSTASLNDIILIWENRVKLIGLSPKNFRARYMKAQLDFFLGAHAAGVRMPEGFLEGLQKGDFAKNSFDHLQHRREQDAKQAAEQPVG